MTDFTTHYLKICDAVIGRVNVDVQIRAFRGRVLIDPPTWEEWVRSQIERSDRFSKDALAVCRGRENVARYARMLAVEFLWKSRPEGPWDVNPSYLEGDDLLDYWRAVIIAGELTS